jgi:hypothetical protein
MLGGQSAAHAASPALQPLASITKQAASGSSTIQQAHYGKRRGWRARCAARHGLHTRGYRRCLKRHVSHSRPYHRKWRVRCANR